MEGHSGEMRRTIYFAAALLVLTATACQSDEPPAPTATAEPLEQTAARWLVEENHDAIQVGDVLVTAEWQEREKTEDPEEADSMLEDRVALSVWDPADMDAPIQVLTKNTEGRGYAWTVDANFDGLPDLCWRYRWGNQPTYSYLWLWDPEAMQFVKEPVFAEISMPEADSVTGVISGWARSSGAGTGLTTFYRWIDGRLTCVRRIEAELNAESEYTTLLLTVEDWMDGALTEVYREEFPEHNGYFGNFFEVRQQWENLDYHGATENAQES